jgi:hypothetical protein
MMSLPSLSHARVAVVADPEQSRLLMESLHRLGLAEIRAAGSLAEARAMAAQRRVDACLVVMPRAVPDEVPLSVMDAPAPGRDAGISSLLFAEVVTPYVERCARGGGYMAAVPLALPPRLLYRRVRALLQRPRRSRSRMWGVLGHGWPRLPNEVQAETGKPKLQ